MSTGLMRREGLRLFMTADAVGGVWQYALDLAHGLATFGVRTTLAVLGPAPDPAQWPPVHAIPDLDLLTTGLLLDWTAGAPDAVETASARLAALAAEVKADLVHLNSPALAAGGAFPVPVVAACHSCVATWWRAVRSGPLPDEFRWRTELVARGLRAADAVVAPTAAFAEAVARTYGLARPPAVVRNGRSLPLVARPLPPAPGEDFVFTAGRLWDDGKNLATLDRAAARLSVPVLAAGPLVGPNGARIRLRHVMALGRLGERDIGRWLAAAPVFASAARYEPFGLAVLEAAQSGCALVLADIATLRELWDGAAVFVAPDDERGFADAIERLIGDPAGRARLGAAARDRSRSYSVEAMTAGVLGLYRALLPGWGGCTLPEETAA